MEMQDNMSSSYELIDDQDILRQIERFQSYERANYVKISDIREKLAYQREQIEILQKENSEVFESIYNKEALDSRVIYDLYDLDQQPSLLPTNIPDMFTNQLHVSFPYDPPSSIQQTFPINPNPNSQRHIKPYQTPIRDNPDPIPPFLQQPTDIMHRDQGYLSPPEFNYPLQNLQQNVQIDPNPNPYSPPQQAQFANRYNLPPTDVQLFPSLPLYPNISPISNPQFPIYSSPSQQTDQRYESSNSSDRSSRELNIDIGMYDLTEEFRFSPGVQGPRVHAPRRNATQLHAPRVHATQLHATQAHATQAQATQLQVPRVQIAPPRRLLEFLNPNAQLIRNEEFMRSENRPRLNNLELSALRVMNYNSKEENTCSICLVDLNQGDSTIPLQCVHVFHENCIKDWLKTKNQCPVCKKEAIKKR